MKKRWVIAIAAAIVLVMGASATIVLATTSDRATIRRATAHYQNVGKAEADGFVQLYDCIADLQEPSRGAMGVHYINPERFDDQLIVDEPEALVYEPLPNGKLKLAAVEYIVPAAAWDSDAAAPEFLGQELAYKTTMGKYGEDDGIAPYYEVHVWDWKRNPAGRFADWNADISCPPAGE
jgi:hypothetical protein